MLCCAVAWRAVLHAPQVFGRVVDPENLAHQAYLPMNAWQIELADSRIGCLRLFSPDNPTGGVWLWLLLEEALTVVLASVILLLVVW